MKSITIFIIFFLIVSTNLSSSKILNQENIDEIGKAYGFYAGQKFFLSRIADDYPELKTYALKVDVEFDSHFFESVQNMEKIAVTILGKEGWQTIKNKVDDQIKNIDLSRINKESSINFIETVERRIQGKADIPMISTFISFHPQYSSNPLYEVLDSLVKEFKTEGLEKTLGLKLGYIVPITWIEKEARAPHIVKKFVGRRVDQGLIQFFPLIKEIPIEVKLASRLLGQEELLEMISSNDVWEEAIPGTKVIDRGNTTIAGEKASWTKISIASESTFGTVYGCGIVYTFIYDNKIVQSYYTVSNIAENTEHGNMKLFELYEDVFKLLASKIYIYNKFE
ncbi:MAG: hypothetical protein KUA37_07480 [Desulfomicrobium sp.]|nr:hypothetical protein [Pseudomonadota bacterium]MBV1711831.1 hypothetical protein [Desulfomicrobium sp.]MBU4572581.1 hypothetical protein [Pseudomonadota bacterium]MBU4593638.1 hypothetical protein [Pseudomonadota bacterium]MBV1719107.1 hypothetical protein [Desulfomicrobium sp.]